MNIHDLTTTVTSVEISTASCENRLDRNRTVFAAVMYHSFAKSIKNADE